MDHGHFLVRHTQTEMCSLLKEWGEGEKRTE